MGDGWSIGNGIEATTIERDRIDQIMNLFPGVKYQIGGTHPLGYRSVGEDRDSRAVIVFASRQFFSNDPIGSIRKAIRNGDLKWGNDDRLNFQGFWGYVNLGRNARSATFLCIDR